LSSASVKVILNGAGMFHKCNYDVAVFILRLISLAYLISTSRAI
jgi:hypothetical protein